MDAIQAQNREGWDQSRIKENWEGMLRNSSNPYVLQEAIGALRWFRTMFEKTGFVEGSGSPLLTQLYGSVDSPLPFSVAKMYQVFSDLATDSTKDVAATFPPDQPKKQVLAMLDEEIKRRRRSRNFNRLLTRREGNTKTSQP